MITATHDQIARASDVIRDGGIVIFPTDTAFGVGCRMDDPAAVDRLFSVRERPPEQATPVLISSVSQALEYFSDPAPEAKRLMDTYWPGALTVVSPCDVSRVYERVRGGGTTIGMRMPAHETILSIIRLAGVPVLGPSANIHGAPTPYALEDLDPEFVSRVDLVVPGSCTVCRASTVVSVDASGVRVIREGAVRL